MDIQNQKGIRAVLITEWNVADLEAYALGNLELISHLLSKCDNLNDVEPYSLGHSLTSSIEILTAIYRQKHIEKEQ